MSICPNPWPSGPTAPPRRRLGARRGGSPSSPVRSKRLELGFPGRERYTRARNARRWSQALVKWEMSVHGVRADAELRGMSRFRPFAGAFLAFYVAPIILAAGCLAVYILLAPPLVDNEWFRAPSKAERFFGGVVTVSALSAINALGFAIPLALHFRARRRGGWRLNAVSAVLAVACCLVAAGAIWVAFIAFGGGFWGFTDPWITGSFVAVVCVSCVAISSLLPSCALLSLSKWGVLGSAQVGYCSRCGYDLRGTKGPACPECGNQVGATKAT